MPLCHLHEEEEEEDAVQKEEEGAFPCFLQGNSALPEEYRAQEESEENDRGSEVAVVMHADILHIKDHLGLRNLEERFEDEPKCRNICWQFLERHMPREESHETSDRNEFARRDEERAHTACEHAGKKNPETRSETFSAQHEFVLQEEQESESCEE